MVEIGTGLALLGSAIGGAKLIEKLLGPTANYIEEGIKTWTEKRVNNVRNIFSIAIKRLGDRIEDEGAVPPKILKGIINEVSYCDDFLSAEYFGGVLASSRSGISRDDRGAPFIALISRLSTYQIRTHYILYHYHIVKNLFNGTTLMLGIERDTAKMQIYVPTDVCTQAMEFDEKEEADILIPHTMLGLTKEDLIDRGPGRGFAYGTVELMQKYFKKATKPGIIFQPSPSGTELFLWAHGRSDLHFNYFLDVANQFEIDSRVSIPPGYQKIKE